MDNTTMNIQHKTLMSLAKWLFGMALVAVHSAAFAATLDNIKYATLPGDKIQVRLELSAPPASTPLNFTIDNPARIALDLPGTTLNVANKTQNIGTGAAHSVSAVEAGGRTRVVLNLVHMVGYDIKLDGNAVVITLDDSVASGPVAVSGAAASTPASGSGSKQIEDIDFRRGPNGEALVAIRLSNPSTAVDVNEQGGQIIADFIDVSLPDKLDRKLDVLDFATPAKEVDVKRRGNGARMVISPASGAVFDHLAYQADNMFTIELKPLTKAEQDKRKEDTFSGEKLSLNFQSIEVRAVLQLLADFTGLNIVASDTVTGNVTLRLKNVPWDQALDIILKSKGLGKRQAGNVIMIAPAEEIATREKLELEALKQLTELAPLTTEYIQLSYAKAKDMAILLGSRSGGSAATGATGAARTNTSSAQSLISERGSVSVDERTNTLLIQETAEKIAEIRELIATLDIPVRQVLIESRIVIANQDFTKKLGVRFGYSRDSTGVTGTQLANRDGDRSAYFLGGALTGRRSGLQTTFNTGGLEDYMVSLPVGGAAGGLSLAVGKIGSYLLQLELTALQAEGKGEVISSPRVVTADQKEAIIEQGAQIPYQEASSSGATSTSFKEAVLKLQVTPSITPDDRVAMDIKVNRDSVGDVFNGIPSIDTNSVSTQVLVDNGETVVLGGVYTQDNRKDVTRVPFFSDIPYLGVLFKRTEVTDDKDELLIFVTPKILKETLALDDVTR